MSRLIGDVSAELTGPGLGLVRMKRPPANYFDTALLTQLLEALQWIDAEGGRAVVLAAAGKHFCAGMNFGSKLADPAGLYELGARLFESELPIVAAVQGSAIGGGLGLAMVADLRVAGASTRFWPNFTRLGLHHGFGLTVTLPAVVGAHRANEMLIRGRPVGAEEALRIGLCDRVVSDAEIEQSALELAAELAAAAPLAVRSVRRTMRAGLAGRVRAATAHELTEQSRLVVTADFREGVRANRERRTPQFTGE
jgi:enoyl-CoA hydratase/carnithine racemase